MLLATCNSQGELSPLEIGLHALKTIGRGKAGRGKKGGLSQYAALIGKSQPYVSQIVAAAEVAKSISQLIDLADLRERCQHLYAIHDLPEELWSGAVANLGEMSASEVEAAVKRAKELLASQAIPAEWAEYLPVNDCAIQVFAGTHPDKLNRLLSLAKRVYEDDWLDEDLREEWKSWLIEQKGGESWDIAKCQEKRRQLEEIQESREEVKTKPPIPSVVLADPPWRYEFCESDNRQIENQYPTATIEEIISHGDDMEFAPDCVLFLWATAPKLKEALTVMEGWGFEYRTNAVWDKERIGMGYWFRGQHELLLVGIRGTPPAPEQSLRCASMFRERRDDQHSRKPECVYKAIEQMYPTAVKLELYCRGASRPGWLAMGNEAHRP
jgi:N6-adenosine-specific RNA methylase IME4